MRQCLLSTRERCVEQHDGLITSLVDAIVVDDLAAHRNHLEHAARSFFQKDLKNYRRWIR
jgi:hypothetical protein